MFGGPARTLVPERMHMQAVAAVAVRNALVLIRSLLTQEDYTLQKPRSRKPGRQPDAVVKVPVLNSLVIVAFLLWRRWFTLVVGEAPPAA